MEAVSLVKIYYDSKMDNGKYLVAIALEVKRKLPLISFSYKEYTREEKDIILAYCANESDLIDFYNSRDKWIDSSYDDDEYLDNLTYVVNRYNDTVDDDSIKYNYFIYRLSTHAFEKVRRLMDIELYEARIKSGDISLIYEDKELLTLSQIEKKILSVRADSATIFAAAYCEKCQKYMVFTMKNTSLGICSCGNHQEIKSFAYMGKSPYDAQIEANRRNNNNVQEKENSIKRNAVYFYLGKTYPAFEEDRIKLHNRIYNEYDGKAIFTKENDVVIFKNEYIEYVSSFNQKLIDEAVGELSTIQSLKRKSDLFDEDVALFWYYHTFDVSSKDLPNFNYIFSEGEVFENPDAFISSFLKAKFEKKLHYLSMLNDPYIKYFFNKDEELFSIRERNVYNAFSKIIYSKTKNYCYINPNSKVIHDFGKSFISDLIIDDENNLLRYEFLNDIYSNDSASHFGLPLSTDYFGMLEDKYDYNCYIYALYASETLQDNYYYFRELRLPLGDGAKEVVREIVKNKYLNIYNNDYYNKNFNDLITLFQNGILSAFLTTKLKAVVDEVLRGIRLPNLENLLDIYIRTFDKKEANRIPIVYNHKINTIVEHTMEALRNHRLSDFIRDKDIEKITNLLYDNKEAVYKNAHEKFTAMDAEIKKLISQ